MTPRVTPYRDGRLYVCLDVCATCVFHPDPEARIDLERGRLRDVVQGNRRAGSALTCHRTIYDDPNGEHAICRGWWDRFKDRDDVLVLAQRLRIVRYIIPPGKETT